MNMDPEVFMKRSIILSRSAIAYRMFTRSSKRPANIQLARPLWHIAANVQH